MYAPTRTCTLCAPFFLLFFLFNLEYAREVKVHTSMCVCLCVGVFGVCYKYKSIFNEQRGKPALSSFRLVAFVCSYLPPLPPPHSAWGVIKSVYVCPQSKEIGTHARTHTRTQTLSQSPKLAQTYTEYHRAQQHTTGLNRKMHTFTSIHWQTGPATQQ